MKKNELISNELKLKKNKINYLYIIIIFISFILGFYYNENSSGGAAIDSTYALINFKIFLSHKFKDIPWEIYSSSSLPLYYFILKFAFSEATKLNMIIANISFSVIAIFYLIKIISMKFDKSIIDKTYIFLYSLLILLSPYFRSSNYWGLEEIIGVLILILTFYNFLLYKEDNSNLRLVYIIFFVSLSFYTRQSYIFLIVFIFFQLFNFKRIFDLKNILIIFLFLIFLLPSFYFFYKWNGLLPPIAFKEGRNLSLFFENIPIILSILIIYLIPFICLSFSNLGDVFDFIKKKFFFILINSAFFIFLLLDYEFKSIGGGAFFKIISYFNLNFYIKILVISLIASLCSTYIFYKLNNNIKICLYILVITFLSIDIVFQEYFDPLIFIIMSTLYNFNVQNSKKLNYFFNFSLWYYFLFLIGANIYYISL